MRIWMMKTGEPVPFFPAEKSDRMLRAGALAGLLSERGHQVTWWTSQFTHQHKKFRKVVPNIIVPGYREDGVLAPDLIFLSSIGYRKHVSLRRLRDHAGLAQKFRELAPQLPRPDVIITSYPTIELCAAAIEFSEDYKVPCIVDVRDLWPDIIYSRLAKPLRRFGLKRTIRFPYYERMASNIFQKAQSVTGLSSGMVEWAANRFERPADSQKQDKVFFQSKFTCNLSQDQDEIEKIRWLERGVDLSAPKTRFVWSGSLVEETDGAALLDAMEQIPEELRSSVEFIMCGTGGLVPRIEKMAKQYKHVVYGGWVNELGLTTLLNHSHIGLLCYLDRFDFQNSIPNKVTDYCVGALRILTNLSGEVERLTKDTDILIPYPTGDVSSLLATFVDIAERPDFYRKKNKASKELFVRHFDAEKVLAEFAEHIESMSHAPLGGSDP